MKKLTKQQIANKSVMILAKLFDTNDVVSWQNIFDEISKEMKIKNWLDVRGALQFMINKKDIVRTKDRKVEEYVTTKNFDIKNYDYEV